MDKALQVGGIALAKVGEALGIANLDPEPGMIFVTGGTGVVSRRVAKKLLLAGYPHLRLGADNQDKNVQDLAAWSEMEAEIATDFAWDRPETYQGALRGGVKTVLCTCPYKSQWKENFPAFVRACKEAGVKHFVKLSFYHARGAHDSKDDDLFQQVPIVHAHGLCDEMLIKEATSKGSEPGHHHSQMSYTLLYASHLMSNPLTTQGEKLRDETLGTFCGASGHRGVNYVSPNDVAEMAVRVMLEPREHYNKEYTLTGRRSITEQQVAGLLGKHLNKPVMYLNLPLHELASHTADESSSSDWSVDDLVALEKVKASGQEEKETFVSKDIETVCGHEPETYEEYLSSMDLMTAKEKNVDAPPLLKPLNPVNCSH